MAKRGFVAFETSEGVLVYPAVSRDLVDFLKTGKPGKLVERKGAGPGGVTLAAPDDATLDAYLK